MRCLLSTSSVDKMLDVRELLIDVLEMADGTTIVPLGRTKITSPPISKEEVGGLENDQLCHDGILENLDPLFFHHRSYVFSVYTSLRCCRASCALHNIFHEIEQYLLYSLKKRGNWVLWLNVTSVFILALLNPYSFFYELWSTK